MISSKSEFLKLWNAGKLGNKLRTWTSIDDASGYDGLFSIRDGRPDSNLSRYNVPREGIAQAVAEMHAKGGRDLYFGEMAPDHRLLIQGEYLDGFLPGNASGNHLNKYLMWSGEKTQMKRVKAWRHSEGSASTLILRSYMNGNSWDDFQELQERHPGNIIEFGAYDCFVGNLPGRNCIIWEVRAY